MLMVLPMLAGAGAMALMYSSRSTGVMGYVMGGMMGMSMLGMVAMGFISQGSGQTKREMITQRRAYMRHLSLHRKKVQRTALMQREAMYYRHPDPDSLWVTAASHRLWERRSADADFGVLRIGTGPQSLSTPIISPQTRPLDELEPLCAAALRRFVMTYSTVDNLPIAMAVNGFSRVLYDGDVDNSRDNVRALIAQAVVHHSPDDLVVAICAGQAERAHWEWAKWLPHAAHPEHHDALGQVRLVAPTIVSIEALLEDLLSQRPRFNPSAPAAQVITPHILVVIDNGDLAGASHLVGDTGVEGVTVLDLSTPPPRLLDAATLVLSIGRDRKMRSTTKDTSTDIGVADGLSIEELEALCRQLAPLRISAAGVAGGEAMNVALGLAELLGMGNPFDFDVDQAWVPRPNRRQLRVPIGVGPEGQPIELDLKEAAQDGMGPHGLLIGATGSGKSELLRTLVLALCTSHNSETLNFVLVDFKGGATFTKLDRLPHTSAVITNLSDELPLVDRMQDAINGELLRRQELLRSAGNYASLRDYEKARLAGAPLAPLPSLLIVCDEFSELLSAKPDFIDMFVQIGRVGRSLGVHLLLASQRLEEGRLRGLDTHLSYRISLRTFSAMESRVVIGTPDAFELPSAPGHGYIKFGTEELTRFRAAYVSGTYRRGESQAAIVSKDGPQVQSFDTYFVAPPAKEETPEAKADESSTDDSLGESLLDILVDQIEGKGVPAHRVWLPPLNESPTLDHLWPAIENVADRGLTVADEGVHGALAPRIGIVDKPLEQRRDTLRLDLAGGDGHIAITGGPQSGKSTAIRTIMTSLAMTHTPQEVQFYCIDLGGGSLGGLRDLPHVGSVAARTDANPVRRTIAELRAVINSRELRFANEGIDGMGTYRRRKRGGQYQDDPFGDVFLIIDGWGTFRTEFEELELDVVDIAVRGLAYGVHVVLSAGRWMDFRPNIRDLLGTKIELRLGDPSDSMLDRRTALNVPPGAPGRGITADKMHMLIGLPRIDGDQDPENLSDGVLDLVARVRDAWGGRPTARRVRLLPERLAYADLRVDPNRGIAVGMAEQDLQPAYIDFATEPHLVVFGDVESGKSAFLRQLGRRITDKYDEFDARLLVIDFRRSLLGAFDGPQLLAYGTSANVTASMIRNVVPIMEERLPGPDVTPEQLRNRSWWEGSDLYILIDDYDLVSAAQPNPLEPLKEFLSQARDIGLHVILTRRSGGAARALYDPFVSRLIELSSPGLLLSGDKGEGTIIGNQRMEPLPPGRGKLITRKHGTQLIQVPWIDPEV